MKEYYAFLILLVASSIAMSCGDKKQKSKTEIVAPADSSIKNVSIENYGVVFKQILKSDAGMARGVSIGDNLETLQENISPSETQPKDGKSFTVYFDDSEINFADILYVKDAENKVEAIAIDIFNENKVEVDNLMKEFVDFFNKKYGMGKGISKMMTWQMPDGNNLMVQDVSTEKDPGLKIVFAKNGDKLLQ